MIAWASAQQMIATYDCLMGVRGMLDPPTLDDAFKLAAQEVSAATSIHYRTAMDQVELAEQVADCQPQSWMALDRGELSLNHVKALRRATRHCPPAVVEAVDTMIVPRAVARRWTPSETARAARKAVLALDPGGSAERAKAAKNDSDVRFLAGDDEMATLVADGEAALARRMMDVLDERAEEMARAGDQRPVGLRRFHALADAVLNTAARPAVEGEPGSSGTGRGYALVKLDLTTWLGLNDNPGELTGYGPISAETARQLAADRSLRRLITDPLTGDGLDLGRRAYKPSAQLRAFIEATRPRCSMIGCTRPAYRCEIDHRIEYLRGGETNPENLQPLCKLHHQMKTKKQWKAGANEDGSVTWTSFLGFTYTSHDTDPLTGDPDPPTEAAA